MSALCQDADLLLHWCYRLDGQAANADMKAVTPTPTEIANMANAAGVRQLVLTHFRVNMDTPAAYRSAQEALNTCFDGEAAIAEDLDEFVI